MNDFEMVPVTPMITGTTFTFALHMRCISLVRHYYSVSQYQFSVPHKITLSPDVQQLQIWFAMMKVYLISKLEV
jgi:hypothetical protein